MSIDKIHKIMDEVLGSSYTNKVLGDLGSSVDPDEKELDELLMELDDEDTGDGAPTPPSAKVDKERDFIADVLMDFLYNNRDPVFVYSMLKDRLNGLEISALIGEVQRLKEEHK